MATSNSPPSTAVNTPVEVVSDGRIARPVANARYSGQVTAKAVQSADVAKRVHQLGERGDPDALPELIAALKHPSSNVRRLAASALRKIRDPGAVEPLLEQLDGEDKPQARQYAVTALGKIGDRRARPRLERIAAASNREAYYVVNAAKDALKRFSSLGTE